MKKYMQRLDDMTNGFIWGSASGRNPFENCSREILVAIWTYNYENHVMPETAFCEAIKYANGDPLWGNAELRRMVKTISKSISD